MERDDSHSDQPHDSTITGRVVLALGNEADEAYDQRNVLGQALRKILTYQMYEEDPDGYLVSVATTAEAALGAVFPGDADGEKGLYDCPTADGREPIMEGMTPLFETSLFEMDDDSEDPR